MASGIRPLGVICTSRTWLGTKSPKRKRGKWAGRVGKEAGLPVPPPSSNRTGGFPASGLPAITQSEACVGHAIQSSPTSKGLAHAGVRRTKFPPEGGRIVDFGAVDVASGEARRID